MSRAVCMFRNKSLYSKKMSDVLTQKLKVAGFEVHEVFRTDAELLICVGGDGSFLHALHACHFPDTPIIGINTGHLGFFQEIDPGLVDEFIEKYKNNECKIQHMKTLCTELTVLDEEQDAAAQSHTHIALNEVVLRKEPFGSAHFNISLGESFVQRFSGDGLLICPPAGSTAYNYALGGSIVDPSLDVVQITPIAPLNTTAYRCLTASLVMPPYVEIDVRPEFEEESDMRVVVDGVEYFYDNVQNIRISLSDKTVKLLRFENYDFWSKVKSKFL